MYRNDKDNLLKEPYPSKMPWYIAGAMGVITAIGAALHFSESSAPACPHQPVKAQEYMPGACNKPLPRP